MNHYQHQSAQAMIKTLRGYLVERNARNKQHITFEKDRTIVHGSDQEKIYIPSSTGKLFGDSTAFVELVIGPYGSGKSTMCVQKIVQSTARMPYWFNNRRKSRWAIVRNTSGELQSTTLQTWLTWFGDLGEIRKRQKPLLTYEHTFNDGNGVIELELIFIALDRPDDVRKIKSLELTGVYLNELSELPQNVLSHFKGRINGRFPSKSFCPEPYWSGIIADTNPPDEDHWIYDEFEKNITPNYKIFHQPSGLLENENGLLKDADGNYIQNSNADNASHLSHDYYPKLAEKQTEGFIKVYCCGRYGLVESGKRIYPEYNDDFHSIKHIQARQGDPIYLGWDFGLTPACVVLQITPRGQILCLKEYIGEDIGIKSFATNIVLPGLARDFPYNKIGGFTQADPAGNKHDEIMEELSCIGELNSLGIATVGATTNDIDVRINSVRYFLNLMVDGKPAFLLDRQNCPVLRKGFVSGYHFKRMQIAGDERYHDKPNKNKYSHCFVGETLISTKDGTIRIDELKLNDLVNTPKGLRKVVAIMSTELASIIELTLEDNRTIYCTPNHPFITNNGIVRADALQYDDILIGELSWEEKQNIQCKSSMGSNITRKSVDIIKLITRNLSSLVTCIEMFGNFIMGLFPKDFIYITSTTTKATMTLATYQSLVHQRMQPSMAKNSRGQNKLENIWQTSGHWRLIGTNQKKVENGIPNMEKKHGKIEKKSSINVMSVIKTLKDLKGRIKKVIVHSLARLEQDDNQELMMKKETVSFALKNSSLIDIKKQSHAPRVVQMKYLTEKREVFDLTVEDEHCFYANGILVGNCHDALQYACMPFAAERIIEAKSDNKQVVDMYNPVLRIFN